jgi:hypothetical protein
MRVVDAKPFWVRLQDAETSPKTPQDATDQTPPGHYPKAVAVTTLTLRHDNHRSDDLIN